MAIELVNFPFSTRKKKLPLPVREVGTAAGVARLNEKRYICYNCAMLFLLLAQFATAAC